MFRLVYQRLTTFFNKWELWYHGVLLLILVPVCNAYFIGPRYISDGYLFLSGTVLLLGLYVLSTVGITLAVRKVTDFYPDIQQSTQRTLAVLGVLSILSAGAVVLDVFIYSRIPWFGTPFTWVLIRPILVMTLLFDFAFCTALSLFYAYRQWYIDQTQIEQLRQTTYQHQLDALKMQINPHFLFNSLTSLSSLIGEDKRRAGQFVDELSKVYRYLLQANTRELVSLQTELTFIQSYTDLLKTRYGTSLQIVQAIDPFYLDHSLPPLSLQLLIDNAVRHNSMLPGKPLVISIRTTLSSDLLVDNTLQRKVNKVETSQAKLANLIAKYRLLGSADVRVTETATQFSVTVPLLTSLRLADS